MLGEPVNSLSGILSDPDRMRQGLEAANEMRKFARGVSQVLTRIVGSGGNVQLGKNEVVNGKTAEEVDRARQAGQMDANMTTQERVYREASARMSNDERLQFQRSKAYRNGMFRSVKGILEYLPTGGQYAGEPKPDADLLGEYATVYLDMRVMLGENDLLGSFESPERIDAVEGVKNQIVAYYNDHPDEAREPPAARRNRQAPAAQQNGQAPAAQDGQTRSATNFSTILKEATEAGEFREVGAPEHLHRNGEPGARAPKTNGTPKKG